MIIQDPVLKIPSRHPHHSSYYPVGTRFHKEFPGYGFYEGHVTGFDGTMYDIEYPEDGDSEVFDITGFDDVEIIYIPTTTTTTRRRTSTSNDNAQSSDGPRHHHHHCVQHDDDEDNKNNNSGKKKKRHPRRTWDEGYQDLLAFYSQHGHCRPKATTLVGRWTADQRKLRRLDKLSEEQIQKLDAIDYDWESREDILEQQWQDMFQILKRYKLSHGHTRVRQKATFRGESLGNWVTSQQSLYRNNTLKRSRQEQLEEIGFEWIRDERLLWKDTDRPLGKVDDDWNAKYGLLCQYQNAMGDTLVPAGYMSTMDDGTTEFDLGAFANRQRMLHRDGLLRPERQEKLEQINFVFVIDVTDADASRNQKEWDAMFDRLVAYKRKYGDCNIYVRDEEDPTLGMWARFQRARYTRGDLQENRFHRLDSIGFCWTPHEDRWNGMVEHLRAYKEKNGDCKVPYVYKTGCGANLGSWVRTVRGARRGTRNQELTAEKIAQLDSLGFVWENILHLHWDIMYDALKHFKETHGHCRVPQSYKGDVDDLPTNLGSWVTSQRQSLESKLEATGDPMYLERKSKLNSIGFDWSLAHVPHEKWNAMFQMLVKYKEKFGNCRVPHSYNDESLLEGPRKLGEWVTQQRTTVLSKANEGNEVCVDRKRRLDSIGFLWEDDRYEENWKIMFERLKQYHGEHGNCRVPSGYDEGCEGLPAKLGNWVGVQKAKIPSKADEGNLVYVERKRHLDSLNFEYDHVHVAQWERMFERLKKYHNNYGHCRVPTTYQDDDDGPSLSAWVSNQGQFIEEKAQSGDLKYVERKRLLDTLDFEYGKADDATWMTMFGFLKTYVTEHGSSDVPLSYSDDNAPRALGRWCYEQRKNILLKLQEPNAIHDYSERKRLLDSLGFQWVVEFEKDKRWAAFFQRLKSFKDEHGHCFVPPDYGKGDEESSLYGWVKAQQANVPPKAENGDTMYVERKRLLDSIGFEWKRIFDDVWDKMFGVLAEYKKKHGHCRVPYRGHGAIDGPTGQLGIWVYGQRTKIPSLVAKGDSVGLERKRRLDELGFEWMDVHSSKWEAMYAGLERFHAKHGHCRVKRDYADPEVPLAANLGSWCSTQRQQLPGLVQQGDEIAIERKERLDALGFVWQTRAPPKAYTRNGQTIQGRTISTVAVANANQQPTEARTNERSPGEQVGGSRSLNSATATITLKKKPAMRLKKKKSDDTTLHDSDGDKLEPRNTTNRSAQAPNEAASGGSLNPKAGTVRKKKKQKSAVERGDKKSDDATTIVMVSDGEKLKSRKRKNTETQAPDSIVSGSGSSDTAISNTVSKKKQKPGVRKEERKAYDMNDIVTDADSEKLKPQKRKDVSNDKSGGGAVVEVSSTKATATNILKKMKKKNKPTETREDMETYVTTTAVGAHAKKLKSRKRKDPPTQSPDGHISGPGSLTRVSVPKIPKKKLKMNPVVRREERKTFLGTSNNVGGADRGELPKPRKGKNREISQSPRGASTGAAGSSTKPSIGTITTTTPKKKKPVVKHEEKKSDDIDFIGGATTSPNKWHTTTSGPTVSVTSGPSPYARTTTTTTRSSTSILNNYDTNNEPSTGYTATGSTSSSDGRKAEMKSGDDDHPHHNHHDDSDDELAIGIPV